MKDRKIKFTYNGDEAVSIDLLCEAIFYVLHTSDEDSQAA